MWPSPRGGDRTGLSARPRSGFKVTGLWRSDLGCPAAGGRLLAERNEDEGEGHEHRPDRDRRGPSALLHQTNQPVQAAAREMIVLELYRRGAISSGKAAELLGTSRLASITHSGLGIPYLEMTEDEWAAEKAASESDCERGGGGGRESALPVSSSCRFVA